MKLKPIPVPQVGRDGKNSEAERQRAFNLRQTQRRLAKLGLTSLVDPAAPIARGVPVEPAPAHRKNAKTEASTDGVS